MLHYCVVANPDVNCLGCINYSSLSFVKDFRPTIDYMGCVQLHSSALLNLFVVTVLENLGLNSPVSMHVSAKMVITKISCLEQLILRNSLIV